jgi:hypothetical protein
MNLLPHLQDMIAGSYETTVTTHKIASILTMEAAVPSEMSAITRLYRVATEKNPVLISTTVGTSDLLIVKLAVIEVTARQ